jgi:hypothetical protein
MYFITAVLLVLSGVFYAAVQHEIGNLRLTAATVAALWGVFVSVR